MLNLYFALGYGAMGGNNCIVDGLGTSCATVANLAGAGALAGVSALLPAGNGGPLMLYLAGGSTAYQDEGDLDGMVTPSSGQFSSFDGEWVTLNQDIPYINTSGGGPTPENPPFTHPSNAQCATIQKDLKVWAGATALAFNLSVAASKHPYTAPAAPYLLAGAVALSVGGLTEGGYWKLFCHQ